MEYLWKLLFSMKKYLKYFSYAVIVFLFGLILRACSRYAIYCYHDSLMNGASRFGFFSHHETYDVRHKSNMPAKYVLLWETFYGELDDERNPIFPISQCPVSKCVFTRDEYFLGYDYTRFDAILFGEATLKNDSVLPKKRSPHQIYVFKSTESAHKQPACEVHNDDFFNWTMTYRVDSDILWSYFVVRDVKRELVAPSKDVVIWTTSNRSIPKSIKSILANKTKAAALLVSHCKSNNLGDDYISKLQQHLFHYSLKIDVYGGCNNLKCTDDNCEYMLAKDYYFYLAFEDSLAEDYVTEKVLHGYHNYVVPIVFGGANYSRFLPPGSYLNARELHPYNLAFLIHEAIKDPKIYEQYFQWTNSYTFDVHPPGLHPLCNLCAALHSKKAQRKQVYRHFRMWWNGLNGMKWCLSEEFWNETSRLNFDGRHVYDV